MRQLHGKQAHRRNKACIYYINMTVNQITRFCYVAKNNKIDYIISIVVLSFPIPIVIFKTRLKRA